MSKLDSVRSDLWQSASTLYLALALLVGVITVTHTFWFGSQTNLVMNAPVSVVVWSLAAAAYALLIVNLLVVSAPGFGLYYVSMLAGFVSVFFVFADVVTNRDDVTQ